MLPPQAAELLKAAGHDALRPADLGADTLDDEMLVQIASAERRVIVTKNAADFAHVATCTVLFIRESWWPQQVLAQRLAAALARWAAAHPEPGSWPHWLEADFR